MKKVALVTGAAMGLGQMIADELHANGFEVIAYDKVFGDDVLKPKDLPERLDVLVNCAGMNIINWCADVKEADWDTVVDVNLKGTFLMAQACLPMLKESKGTILNIVSNAAHLPMRCSAAYNASKGGALILTKQLAREFSPDVTVFSVSPNRLEGTPMSDSIDDQVTETRGWSKEYAKEYQNGSLLAGEETKPEYCAELIGFLLSTKERHKYLAGCDVPYGV